MAPLTYTNAWDESAPADSSLANLLGQDIRTMKLDVRERLRYQAGGDGSQPTLPNIPYTSPGTWAGMLFFATDVGKIYEYSGTAWFDVSANFGAGLGAVGPAGPAGPTGPTGPAGPSAVLQSQDTFASYTGAQNFFGFTVPAGTVRVRSYIWLFVSSGAFPTSIYLVSGSTPVSVAFNPSSGSYNVVFLDHVLIETGPSLWNFGAGPRAGPTAFNGAPTFNIYNSVTLAGNPLYIHIDGLSATTIALAWSVTTG